MKPSKHESGLSGLLSELPMDRLRDEAADFGHALTHKGLSSVSGRIGSVTDRLSDITEGTTRGKVAKNMAKGDSPVKAGLKGAASKVTDQVKDAFSNLTGMGGSGSNAKLKVTNILEHVDVPVNRQVAYDQWTQFEDFPKFMKKVETVSQEEDEKLAWKAQIFWSHRSWTATITDQVPGERIVWKSQGQKGHVDGAITFHELAPDLTRVLMVLEYHPKGLFEHTGNLWRAQGRRARLELKHFARHVATQTLLHQDELDGWHGEIHDGKVKKSSSRSTKGSSTSADGSSSQSRTRKQTSGRSSTSRSSSGGSSSGGSSRSRSSRSGSSGSGSSSSGSSSGRSRTAAARTSPRRTTSASTSSGREGGGSASKTASSAKSTGTSTAKTTARKTSAGSSTAKKAAPRKSTAKKATAKTTAKKTTPRKSTSRGSTAKTATAAK
ncbi:hypothetical protein GCM10027053_39990 [Intrasporangium mesophilum]